MKNKEAKMSQSAKITPDQIMTWVGHIFFWCMISLSVYWYKERVLAFDAPYMLLKMFEFDGFFIAHSRYVNYLTEFLPAMAIKSGASLKTILILTSASMMTVCYALFCIATYLFKNPKGAFLIVITICLFMRYKWFMPVSEMPFTTELLAFFIAWMTRPKEQINWAPVTTWAITLLLGFVVIMGHPLVGLPFLVFIGFDTIFHKKWLDKSQWALLILIGLGYLQRYMIVQANPYEKGKTKLMTNFELMLANPEDFHIVKVTKWYFNTELHVPLIFSCLVIAGLFYIKKHLNASYMILALIALLAAAMTVSSGLGTWNLNLFDGYLGMMGLAIGIAWVYLMKADFRYKQVMTWITVVIIGFSMTRIYNRGAFFENRIDIMEATIDKYITPEQRKVAIPASQFKYDDVWDLWAFSISTVMLTSIDGPNKAATVYTYTFDGEVTKNGKLSMEKLKSSEFLGPWFGQTYFRDNRFPRQYFNLPKQDYVIFDK